VIAVAARSVLTFACLMLVGSILMLLVVRPGTAEFVISVVTLLLGGLLLAVSAVVLRASYARETVFLDPAGEPSPTDVNRTRTGLNKEEA